MNNMSINFNTIRDGICNAFSKVKNAIGKLGSHCVKLLSSLPEPVKVIGAFGTVNGTLLPTTYRVSNYVYDHYFKKSPNEVASWKNTSRLPADCLNAVVLFAGNYTVNRVGKYGFGMPVIGGIALAGTLVARAIWQYNNSPSTPPPSTPETSRLDSITREDNVSSNTDRTEVPANTSSSATDPVETGRSEITSTSTGPATPTSHEASRTNPVSPDVGGN